MAVNVYQAVKQAMQDLVAPQLESLRADINTVASSVNGLRVEVQGDLSLLRGDIKTELGNLRTEVRRELALLRGEIRTFRGEIRARSRFSGETSARSAESRRESS